MSGPSYSDRRPLSFVPGACAVNDTEVLRVLAAVTTLESHDTPGLGDPETLTPEWAALQARYELLLDMVGQLLARDVSLPPSRDLEFAMNSLSWVEPQELSLGPGRVQLFLNDGYPRPLVLPGQLSHQSSVEDGERYLLEFDPLSPPLRAALERHVFRHHRRAVARLQSAAEAETAVP